MRALIALAITLCLPFALFAGTSNHSRQDEVISRILLELPHYVHFQSKENIPTLCVPGNVDFYNYIGGLNAKLRSYSVISNAIKSNCSYIYIENQQQARRLLSNDPASDAIIISNYGSFIDEGGPIAIVDNTGRIEIYLNLTAIKKQNANFSPDLIELSKKVIQ